MNLQHLFINFKQRTVKNNYVINDLKVWIKFSTPMIHLVHKDLNHSTDKLIVILLTFQSHN